MKHVILGTAGHIDHGKTALIRALTGIDTDRLKEEKERGISIDLGFAHLDLPGDIRLGIVDVPGHERFVKNMLAGAGGIDAVLLVVAADEGVMPQTREHLAIVELLGVTAGVVALTKRDLVDDEWLELAETELRTYLEPSSLASAAIVPVSAVTGAGLDELRAALAVVAASVPARADTGPARLPVDRVFTIDGFGTVVTGTLWSGRIKVGDRLQLLPLEREVRVRNVQVHEESVEAALAGQRTAVALHGVERAEIERGHVVASPGYFRPTHMIDARLQVVRDLAGEIENRQRLRFHIGASEVLGRIVLLDSDDLRARQSALVEFRLESPVVAQPGDRFVVRSYSPMQTVAGGLVIDLPDRKRRRFREDELQSLLTREQGSGTEVAEEHLRSAGLKGLTGQELERAASLAAGDGAMTLERLVAEGRALQLQGGKGAALRFIDQARVEEIEARVLAILQEHGTRFPLRWGMGKEELRSRLPREMGLDLFQLLLDRLAASGQLQVRRDRVRGGSGDLALPEVAEAAARDLVGRFGTAGMAPPGAGEIATGWAHRGVDLSDLLELLCERGDLTKVAPDLYYSTTALDRARTVVLARLDEAGEIGIPDFKALFGISRKWAVPLLEMFDREGTTRRVGDKRVRGRNP